MNIRIERRELDPSEYSEATPERQQEFNRWVNRPQGLSSPTHLIRLGKPQKMLGGAEQLGVYVKPFSTGTEVYLNDVCSLSAPEFSHESLIQVVYTCLDTMNIEVDRRRN